MIKMYITGIFISLKLFASPLNRMTWCITISWHCRWIDK